LPVRCGLYFRQLLRLLHRPATSNTTDAFIDRPPVMATEPQAQCEACGKPATSKCRGCKTDTYAHAYCGPECQKTDWPKYKSVCKDLQLEHTLERVAVVAQDAYLNFRELTWDTPIDRIETRAGEIITYDGDQMLNTRMFLKFPSKMIKEEKMRAAILTNWMCNEPLAFMFTLMTKLLQGL
jgi:hypothetical protein